MKQIYVRAAYAFRVNIWLILGLIGFETLSPIFLGEIGIGTKIVVVILVTGALHRAILLGASFGPAPHPDPRLPRLDWPKQPGWRLWVLMLAIFGSMIVFVTNLNGLLSPFVVISDLADAGRNGVVLLSILLFFWLILSVGGTAIPAAVVTFRTSPGDVLRRIRYSFLFIAGGLLIGPGAVGTINLTATVTFLNLGVVDAAWTQLSDITATGALFELLHGLLRYFCEALTAAVLSEGYLRALERTGQNVTPDHTSASLR